LLSQLLSELPADLFFIHADLPNHLGRIHPENLCTPVLRRR
jgi:hypothetical protein